MVSFFARAGPAVGYRSHNPVSVVQLHGPQDLFFNPLKTSETAALAQRVTESRFRQWVWRPCVAVALEVQPCEKLSRSLLVPRVLTSRGYLPPPDSSLIIRVNVSLVYDQQCSNFQFRGDVPDQRIVAV